MFWAAEGKVEQLDRMAWNHTSHLLAVLINAHRDPEKSKAVEPRQLNPWLIGVKAERKKADAEDLKLLKEVFTRGQKK